MANVNPEIIRAISEYMRAKGGYPNEWYVGIAKDARERLFKDHGVYEQTDSWIYDEAISSESARLVEKYFVEQVGTDGGTGGGDSFTRMVYAYKKAYHTDP